VHGEHNPSAPRETHDKADNTEEPAEAARKTPYSSRNRNAGQCPHNMFEMFKNFEKML